MVWSTALAFAVICLIMYIGDVISTRSGGRIPQMLIVAIFFLFGFWTIFPTDILNIGNITPMANLMMSIILIHVGTMFNIQNMKKEWKTVVVTLAAVIGIVGFTIGVGTAIFGKEIGFVSSAPMTGGGMAAKIMQDAATAVSRPELGTLAMMIFIMHGFFGFPLTAYMLNKECKTLLGKFRTDKTLHSEIQVPSSQDNVPTKKLRLIEKLPKRYRTTTFYIAQLAVISCICFEITALTGISNPIIQILAGILISQLGLIEDAPLVKTESFGILNLALLASFMGSFALATPELVLKTFVTIIVLMSVATVGLVIFSVFLGRRLGFTTHMSIAIGLNCYLGFPFNFALTNEAIRGATQDEKEAAFLNQQIMPKMIIAGIVSVSIVSTIIAGVIASFVFV